jgi:hypothetical protein
MGERGSNDDRGHVPEALRESFLQLLSGTEKVMEELTLRFLPQSRRAPLLYSLLGDALRLLSDMASCAWGCRGGDHLVEHLIRRFCNFALAAHRLTFAGYYDEAFALIRNASELANLFRLFVLAPERLAHWKAATREGRFKEFTPIAVRIAIEGLGAAPVVSREVYQKLCEAGTHVTAISAYSSHRMDGRGHIGAAFSPFGLLVVLDELAYTVAPTLPDLSTLAGAPDAKSKELLRIGSALAETASWLRITNYEDSVRHYTEYHTDFGPPPPSPCGDSSCPWHGHVYKARDSEGSSV